MHTLYFVRLKKEEAKKAQDAINLVNNLLEQNNFTSDSVGYWGGCKADWYVVGGRWSGELELLKQKKDFYKEVRKLVNAKDFGYHNEDKNGFLAT